MLQPLLDQAKVEVKTQGKPVKKTLLEIALLLVRWAPNYYSDAGDDSYTTQEKDEAKQLLINHGYEQYTNLSPRYKHKLLASVQAELQAPEA
jgi:hypothetical protein